MSALCKKASVRIPTGYKRIRIGDTLRRGDLWLDPSDWTWNSYTSSVGQPCEGSRFPDIRPARKSKRGAPRAK